MDYTICLALSLLLAPCVWSDSHRFKIKVSYYSHQLLTCSNAIEDTKLYTVFWITPEAMVIKGPKSARPKDVQYVNATTLNITKVDDDRFGYYYCVIVDGTDNSSIPDVTQWGLNVDGADFSALEEEYRRNAIIGAIAAAVMLVLVGGGCVVWNYRYGRRTRAPASTDKASIEAEEADPKKEKMQSHLYDNSAFISGGGDVALNEQRVSATDVAVSVVPNGVNDAPGVAAQEAVAVVENGGEYGQPLENFRM